MRRISFFLVLLLSIIWVNSLALANTNIVLRHEAIVNGKNVYLKDIALLDGELSEELSKIRIVASPSPGGKREIEKRYIILRLRQLGYEENTVIVRGPEKVIVERAFQEISKKFVEDLAFEKIKDVIPKWAKRYEVFFDIPTFSKYAPTGNVEIFLDIPSLDKVKGRYISFPVTINIDGKKWKKFYVNCRLVLYADVPVAVTSIKKGERITKKDYKIEEKKIERPSFPYINPDEIDGYVALKNIYVGNIIDLTYISRPYQIRRGEIVNVILKRGAITIMLKAQALENGSYGDMIQLKNLKSGKKFTGIIKDFGLVIVK